MFEKGNIIPHDSGDAETVSAGGVESADLGGVSARSSEALRAIDWSELTARLNAARDLRRELREDAMLCAGSSGASFGDAAASYFKALGNGERGVNPDSLESCKASHGTPPERLGDAVEGEARDNT
ncbi:MAG: hypothetical protein AAF127_06030 [Pseudomonadota bacterium]